MKCALSNYTINSCPGLEEISGRRMAPTGAFPTGASIQRLSAGPAPSSCYFFPHFILGSFAFWLLCVQTFVSFLLYPSIFVGRLTA